MPTINQPHKENNVTKKRTVIPTYKVRCNTFDNLIEIEFSVPDDQIVAIRLNANQSRELIAQLNHHLENQ
ncbi:hypothetical protein DaDZ19_09740 [Dickeya ananatis]